MTAIGTARRFGVALVGLLVGAAIGLGLEKVIGMVVVAATGGSSVTLIGLGLLLSYLIPVLAVVGLLCALRMDANHHLRGGQGR